MSNEWPSNVAPIAAELDRLPGGLAYAFVEYERAILDNDLPVLAKRFAADASRADARGLVAGADELAAFRSARGGVAPRTLTRLVAHRVTDTDYVCTAQSTFASGGVGYQTQLWRMDADGEWRIHAAHVTGRAPAFDRAVWRVVGNPLLPAEEAGPLTGRRLAVKDLFAVRGFATGMGNPDVLDDAEPEPRHAKAVELLLGAGAELTGITQTDEFAYSIAGMNVHYGTPPNPAAPGRISGGSSSGSASAVALGQADIGLGTDTGGSIRVPASYQGLWGIRTTHGSVPADGLHPLAPRFDTVGWLTRTGSELHDVARVLVPTQGEPAGSEMVVLDGLDALASPRVAAAFTDAIAPLGSLDTVSIPWLAEVQEAFRVVQAYQAWASDGEWVRGHLASLGPGVRERFEAASRIERAEYEAALIRLEELRQRTEDALDGRILALPSAASVAPGINEPPEQIDVVRGQTLRLTSIGGLTGRPAVSVPAASIDGLPLGVCLLGVRGSDLDLIRVALELATR